MGLCRKVNHDVQMFFFKQLIHSFAVTDVSLHKAEVRIIHNRCQCGQIACVGQLVQTDDPLIRILLQHMKHKVTTNKTGTAGNNNIHFLLPHLSKNNSIFRHSSQMFTIRRLSIGFCRFKQFFFINPLLVVSNFFRCRNHHILSILNCLNKGGRFH